MSIALLLLAVTFLAYCNGANDNFKGVASLFGSRTTSYRAALTWATIATLAGSICSVYLARSLLRTFSGSGLAPAHVVGSEYFLLAVAFGAGATVMLATVTGFPISTTHGLTGAIVGAGLAAAGMQVNFGGLGRQFLLPLLLSPLLAAAAGAALHLAFGLLGLRPGITQELCLCVGAERPLVPVAQPPASWRAAAAPTWAIAVGSETHCSQRYAGAFLGINIQSAMDAAHFLSAGAVSFARGLNDTPKMAALLLVVPMMDARTGMALVAAAIALGGWLNARRVAETMSFRITRLDHGAGFAANAATALLVIAASGFGLPVSTTHVSVGALFGIGVTTRQAQLGVLPGILLSWVVTLPCAAIISGLVYLATDAILAF